jgi:peptidoglycan/xylan/chitin deacetylase (PgdA/CDA1 family)
MSKMIINRKNRIPVFMYHSVGIINTLWDRNQLTCPYEVFEKQLRFLNINRYTTIHLNDLFEFIVNQKPLPDKAVILTFDDGYADNYIFAYPLLIKYGFKGTIFVNPDFTDPHLIKRDRIDQVQSIVGIETGGFLSWDEMREMESSGLIDIQSHAMTHTWYPCSDEIIDFRHPRDDYKWMTWNYYRIKKPFLQIDDENLVRLGQPVYKFEKSLMTKRYFPDKNLDAFIIDYVDKHGNSDFFNNPDWKNVLISKVDEYRSNHPIEDSYETKAEWLKRLKNELLESKAIIEKQLQKKVSFLCWPGGSGTKEGVMIAKSIGYKMTTAAKDLSPQVRKKIKNDGLLHPERIARISPIMYAGKASNGRTSTVYCNGFGMWLRIVAFKNIGLIQKLLNGLINFYGRTKYLSSTLNG